MNLTDKEKLKNLADDVFSLIDSAYVHRLIDEPILRAADNFYFKTKGPISPETFHEVIGKFVRHLYDHGLGVARRLTMSQAQAEAIAIIEASYYGPVDRRCDNAFWDAIGPMRPGIKWVLTQMTEAIIIEHRAQYKNWVFGTLINSLNWETKCRLTEFILSQHAKHLPEEVAKCQTPQIVQKLSVLITFLADADRYADRIRSSHIP
jgi:hypothetical protein